MSPSQYQVSKHYIQPSPGLFPSECGGSFGINDIYDSPKVPDSGSPYAPPQPIPLFMDNESGNGMMESRKGSALTRDQNEGL